MYARPPSAFYTDSNVIWKLKRAVYGLRTSPKCWQDHLSATLTIQLKYVRCQTEPNLYHRRTQDSQSARSDLFVLIYVDDILFFGDSDITSQALAEMAAYFLVKDLGEVGSSEHQQKFLGRYISREGQAIQFYDSPDYFQKLLQEFGLHNCKSTSVPSISKENHQRMTSLRCQKNTTSTEVQWGNFNGQ